MMKPKQELWTIEQLTSRVAETLAGQRFAGVASGRVRDVPDLRTIRYYTTLGLLDRPTDIRGRTAYYGQRHLLQLVAIKRLQAQGLTLAEVQQRLVGQSDQALARLALRTASESTGEETTPHRAAAKTAESAPTAPVDLDRGPEAVRLDPSTALVIRPLRPLTDRDRRLIRMATGPLLELLRLNGLIGPDTPPGDAQ